MQPVAIRGQVARPEEDNSDEKDNTDKKDYY